MNHKELKELIEFLIEKDIAEFELERGDVKVKIKRAGEHSLVHTRPEAPYVAVTVPQSGPPAVAAPPGVPPALPPEPGPEENFHIVKSPIVGTFYAAPSPRAPPFGMVGALADAGPVLCFTSTLKTL